MTTAPGNAELFDGARRARTLRWLLKLRTAHRLPMPKRIDFSEISSPTGDDSVLRYLVLELDTDTDITGWAHADRFDQFPVTGQTHTWTHLIARTPWRTGGPRVDYHQIQVLSNHHHRPRTDLAVPR